MSTNFLSESSQSILVDRVDREQSVCQQSSLMKVVVVVTPCVISWSVNWREEWIMNEGRGRCDQLRLAGQVHPHARVAGEDMVDRLRYE